MKVLIYSDVHGNLPAFELMIKREKDCEMQICLGDLVNYLPWNNECVDLAFSLSNSIVLMGNHEEAFLRKEYTGSNDLVKQFFGYSFTNFDRFELISNLISSFQLDNYLCKHTIRDQYIYPDTSISLDNNYIIGHSHHQFDYRNNGYILYNPGSVGQNRKYINLISYLVYNLDNKSFEKRNIQYEISPIVKEMKVKGYSSECIDYYLNKKMI